MLREKKDSLAKIIGIESSKLLDPTRTQNHAIFSTAELKDLKTLDSDAGINTSSINGH
jgi:hypothetical protein